MKTSMRKLRNAMKSIFDAVQQGEEVIVYSHKRPLAKIIPIKNDTHEFKSIGFGMWKDSADSQNVAAYARQLRKGRHHDR